LLLALLFLAAPVAADDGPVDEKLLVKIDPELLRELDSSRGGSATFLVYLGRQADLRPRGPLVSAWGMECESGEERPVSFCSPRVS